jgi:hypothetical protein
MISVGWMNPSFEKTHLFVYIENSCDRIVPEGQPEGSRWQAAKRRGHRIRSR